jgi:signal transduction histidine kinase
MRVSVGFWLASQTGVSLLEPSDTDSGSDPFADRPGLAVDYEAERQALLVSRLRLTCWIAVGLVPLFGVLDAIIYPHLLRPFLLIRLAMLLAAIGALMALRSRLGSRMAAPLSMVMVCITGLGIVLMTAFSGGTSDYYAGINLVLLAAAVLLPWEASWSLAVGAILVSAYVASAVFTGLARPRLFVAQLFFLCSTVLISVVSHAARERSSRREFQQRAALVEAGRHRDEFLANITHELRTPLAAILGFVEMLTDYRDITVQEQREWLQRIQANATTLYRLIVQLLDFSRMQAGAMRLQREPVDLAAVVSKVAADMRAIAGDGGVGVGTEINGDLPSVMGDPGRIEEIVTNLAANALKFSAGRPIQLALRRGSLGVTGYWERVVPIPAPVVAADLDFAEISVTDRGVGIERADLRRLFVAFQQLDGSSTRRQGGTGLGLAISARLAAAMGGHIAVRSAPGRGSTFALFLPVAVSD